MQVDALLLAWITNYLMGQKLYIWHCLISLPLHIYTSDFRYTSKSYHLQKFLDDLAIVGCISVGHFSTGGGI